MQLEIIGQGQYQTKQKMVYYTLRQAIMHCQLQPGQRLVIEDIAHQLHVSPIPVREALQLLQSEGLAENTPHVGASVAPISRDSLIEVFSLMEGLELIATRIAAARLTPEQIASLRQQLTDMDVAVQKGDYERWTDQNARFHLNIARITAMPMLQEMTARSLDHWARVRRYFFDRVRYRRLEQAQEEHHAMVDAMQSQDYPALEQLVKAHNQGALATYVDYLPQNGAA
jgi:DNA-binding GntR family transcriptional regulator